MTTVFWDSEGVLLVNIWEKNIVKSDYHDNVLSKLAKNLGNIFFSLLQYL